MGLDLKYARIYIVAALLTIIALGSVSSIVSINAITSDEIQKLGKERAAKTLDKVIDRLRHASGQDRINNQTILDSAGNSSTTNSTDGAR